MLHSDRYDEVNYSIESSSEGCSPDFFLSASSTIRADIPLYTIHNIKIWGQLRTTSNLPLSGITIKLLQMHVSSGNFTCSLMGELVTDHNGFYLFQLVNQPAACYHLVIYAPNSLYNKILNPKMNHCTFQEGGHMICQQALLHYLDTEFPYTFGYNHFIPQSQDTSIVTKIYAIPCYR